MHNKEAEKEGSTGKGEAAAERSEDAADEASKEGDESEIVRCTRARPFPYTKAVSDALEDMVLHVYKGQKFDKALKINTGAWHPLDNFFAPYWAFEQAWAPYWGGTKGKEGADRYNTLTRGRDVPDEPLLSICLGGAATNLGGMCLDMCAGLHDLMAWGDLEKFLCPCGATKMMWRQVDDPWGNPGQYGEPLVWFESKGPKFEALFGWWAVSEAWCYQWCGESFVEKVKDFPNHPFAVNQFEYRPNEEQPKYEYNVPGTTDGKKFVAVPGATPNEAKASGWDTLKTTRPSRVRKEQGGFMTNLTLCCWNKGHPTNEWLFKCSVTDPNDKKKTKEHGTVYAPTRRLVTDWCDHDSLAEVCRLGPYKYHKFATGSLQPVAGDCMVDAVMQHPEMPLKTKNLLELARPALGGSHVFGPGMHAVAGAANSGSEVIVNLIRMEASRIGACEPDKDGFYVFRVAPLGGNGWQYHAVACVVVSGEKTWAEKVEGAYEGYRVTVKPRKKRKRLLRDIVQRTDVILAGGQKGVLCKKKGYPDMIELPNGRRSRLLAHAERQIDAGGFTQFAN